MLVSPTNAALQGPMDFTSEPGDPTASHWLAALLAQHDSRASDLLERNAAQLEAAFPAQFAAIDRCIQNFDFDQALLALQAATKIDAGLVLAHARELAKLQTLSILLVDDTPGTLTVMSRVLNRDWRVLVANNGPTALQIAGSDTPPNLIVLDIAMPQMDGLEVCSLLQDNPKTRNIPVVFYTGKSDAVSEKRARELGAADYITKPINAALARQRISNLLAREGRLKALESQRERLDSLMTERSLQLLDRNAQLNAFFEISPDGFVSFGAGGRVQSASPAFYLLTGLNDSDIVDLNEDAFAQCMTAQCRNGSRFPGFVALRAARQGSRHRLEWKSAGRRVLEFGLHASESASVSQILHVRDVSHETAVDELKSEFLSSAAHELRTPMACIYGFAETLLREDLDPVTRNEVLVIIFKQTKLMASITSDLVDLDRIASRRGRDFDFKTHDLEGFLLEWLCHYPTPEQRDAACLQGASQACQVSIDGANFRQALSNVLCNAYKYSPVGSAVTLRLRFKTQRGRPLVGIEVRDQGIGMTPGQAAQCLDRFYRADTSGQQPGAGLGLSLVREILALHQGHTEIQSALGQGTAFTLWLPERALLAGLQPAPTEPNA